MSRPLLWGLVVALAVIVLGVPVLVYRTAYTTSKRLRVVEDGKLYRSGQMTADGFADAVRRLGIRTVINVQDDYPDPDIRLSAWDPRTVKESKLCQRLGVEYVFIAPDLIDPRLLP